MTIASRLLERILKLPPADSRDVVVTRDVEVPMRDGVVLLADHYAPRGGAGTLPTVLIRTPYGRRSFGALFGRPLAERGYQVLSQSCRGTFGSGGTFDPFRQEHADGVATVKWIKQQPWFSGDLVTIGPSYLGFVQWALARDPDAHPKAMAVQVAPSDFRASVYKGGSFALDTVLRWTSLVEQQEGGKLHLLIRILRYMLRLEERKLRPAFAHLPLRDTDRLATGHRVGYFQDWLEHNAPGDPWWASAQHGDAVNDVTAPIHLLGGWYDLFLPGMVRDYEALRDAGNQPYLTIGPWAHNDSKLLGVAVRESLAWFDAQIKGDRGWLRTHPMRLYITGAEEWRHYPDFPPPGTRPERWHLHAGGVLSPTNPTESAPDRYRYDPADPTPAVGGPLLGRGAGPVDNRPLEKRPDVLTYTSGALQDAVEVIGPVSAELFVRSSLEHTDFFARLCDVDPSGKSTNVCDALLRVAPGRPAPRPDGSLRLEIKMWPTAHRFRRGHRIRLQVSSGAHPRYARNPGSGEPLGEATKLLAADQEVFHDPAHPSALITSVLG